MPLRRLRQFGLMAESIPECLHHPKTLGSAHFLDVNGTHEFKIPRNRGSSTRRFFERKSKTRRTRGCQPFSSSPSPAAPFRKNPARPERRVGGWMRRSGRRWRGEGGRYRSVSDERHRSSPRSRQAPVDFPPQRFELGLVQIRKGLRSPQSRFNVKGRRKSPATERTQPLLNESGRVVDARGTLRSGEQILVNGYRDAHNGRIRPERRRLNPKIVMPRDSLLYPSRNGAGQALEVTGSLFRLAPLTTWGGCLFGRSVHIHDRSGS